MKTWMWIGIGIALSALLLASMALASCGGEVENDLVDDDYECEGDDAGDDEDDSGDDDDDDDDDDSGDDDDDDDDEVRFGWVVGAPFEGNAVVLHTADGGEQWEMKSTGLPAVSFFDVSAVDEMNAWVVGAADEEGYGAIFKTTDGGQTWQRQGGQTLPAGKDLAGVCAVHVDTAWAVGFGGLIAKTTDGGSNWSNQGAKDVPEAPLYKVDATDDMNAWIIGDDCGLGYATVLRTTDGGQTWNQLGSAEDFPMGLIDVSAIDETTAWIVGIEGKAHLTTDGGQNWKTMQVIPDLLHVNAVCALDPSTAWIATDQGGVQYTTNGGDDWIDVSPSPDSVPGIKGFELLSVVTQDGQTVWTAGNYAGYPIDSRIALSRDQGASWTNQSLPDAGLSLLRVSFVGACK